MHVKRKGINIRDMIYVAVFAAITVICSWITVPSVVPFTMQTFAFFTAAAFLGTKKGIAVILVYIALGMAGLPVFSGFKGGIGVIFGPTGGYIVGFLFSTVIIGGLCKKLGRSFKLMVSAMLLGLIACYIFGTLWFMLLYIKAEEAVSFGAVLMWCIAPFVIPDLIKIVLAAVCTKALLRTVKSR